MKRLEIAAAMVLVLVFVFGGGTATGQVSDLLKGFQKSSGAGGGGGGASSLPDATIADGLKEALAVGSANAVGAVSGENGYFGNPQIKIPLPDTVQRIAPALRAVGYGEQIDAFELSMNRAAEKAAPMAKDIFLDAVRQMSFADARNILNGPENAATRYLEEKTGPALGEAFKPIVSQSMSEVGVTRAYQDLESRAKAVPFASMVDVDLDGYVTGKALDGLFYMLGQEEARIRQNPSARVTDLLETVFSGN